MAAAEFEIYVSTQAELARLFGKSAKWVEHWARNGDGLGKVKNQGWPVGEWIRFHAERNEHAGGETNSEGEPIEPRERQKFWDAKMSKLKYEAATKALVSRAEHEQAMTWMAREMVAAMQGGVGKIVSREGRLEYKAVCDRVRRGLVERLGGKTAKTPRSAKGAKKGRAKKKRVAG